MKKTILFLILLIFFILPVSAKNKPFILFASEDFTQVNFQLKNEKIFREGQKVYYLFVMPKKLPNDIIRVQVFKMTDKNSWGDVNIVRTKDYRIMKDEKYYHTNYFTFYEKGRYVMQIFSHNDLQRPVAYNDFWIK